MRELCRVGRSSSGSSVRAPGPVKLGTVSAAIITLDVGLARKDWVEGADEEEEGTHIVEVQLLLT